MLNQKPKQGTRIRLMGTSAKKNFFPSTKLTPGLRGGYALLSFLLGATYLKVIFGSDLPSYPILIGASVLGVMCFTVCTFNLVSILRKNN